MCIYNDAKRYIRKIEKLKFNKELSFEYFQRIRAEYANAAFSTVPHILKFVALVSQITEHRFKANKSMAMKILKKLRSTATTNTALNGLKYIHISQDYMEIVLCIDNLIAVNSDRSSQLGMLAMLYSKMDGAVIIIHLTSMKSKRVCKSILAADLFSLVDGYDIGYTTAYTLGELYGRKVNLTIYTDFHSLYGLCISWAHTTERRDITDIIWIKEERNSADDQTKKDPRLGTLLDVL